MDAASRIGQLDREVTSKGGSMGPNRPETLARALEDGQIDDLVKSSVMDVGTRRIWMTMTAAQSRLESILQATANPAVPGLQTGGAIKGWDDTGFRVEYQDPHPSSNNQVGHFLTAVALGTHPHSVRSSIGASWSKGTGLLRGLGGVLQRDPLLRDLGVRDVVDPFGHYSDEEVAIRLMVGHEKVADPTTDPSVFLRQFAAATTADVAVFRSAERLLGGTLPLNTSAAAQALRGISVNDQQRGNSYQDLLLSLVGWRLGGDIAAQGLKDGAAVAGWLRSTLK